MLQKPHILIADDDDEDRLLLRTAFEAITLTSNILYMEGGLQVLQYLDALSEAMTLPALIVLDLNMPKLDGLETLKRLKNNPRYKDIPVIVYTTSVLAPEKERCLALGAEDFIKKPVSFSEIKSVAQFLLRYAGIIFILSIP
jgi:CheY-like chemotaxis protein